jgi:hypothetical protein
MDQGRDINSERERERERDGKGGMKDDDEIDGS